MLPTIRYGITRPREQICVAVVRAKGAGELLIAQDVFSHLVMVHALVYKPTDADVLALLDQLARDHDLQDGVTITGKFSPELIGRIRERFPFLADVTNDAKRVNGAVTDFRRRLGRSLAHRRLGSIAATVEWAVQDYNEVRPHIGLGGLCPIERYTDPRMFLDLLPARTEAIKHRLEENRRRNG